MGIRERKWKAGCEGLKELGNAWLGIPGERLGAPELQLSEPVPRENGV